MSRTFDEHLDLDNLDLNKQRLNNGPRTQLVQVGVTTQHSWAVALTGQNELVSFYFIIYYQIIFTFLYIKNKFSPTAFYKQLNG